MTESTVDNPILQAIRAAGGPTAVAAHFKVSRVSVHEWVQNGRIPSDKAPIVADLAAKAGSYFALESLCPPFPWGVAKAHMEGAAAEPAPTGITPESAGQGVVQQS